MMVVVVAAAGAALVMLVMVLMPVVAVMMVLVLRMLVFDLLEQLLSQRMAGLHHVEQLRAGQLIPRGGDNARILVVATQQGDALVELFRFDILGAAEQDGARVLDLVQEKLSKVLGIHLALHRVRNCDKAVEEHRFVFGPRPVRRG